MIKFNVDILIMLSNAVISLWYNYEVHHVYVLMMSFY